MNIDDFILLLVFLIIAGVIIYNLFYFGRDLSLFPRAKGDRPKINIYTN
jgi:hypothetical protein